MKYERSAGTPRKKWHEERRRTVRVPVDLVVAYSIYGSRPIIAQLTELANTSFRIVAREPIAVGARLTIAFPAGTLLAQNGTSRVHVFEGIIVHAAPLGVHYHYGIDLVVSAENVADLRWTVLQRSLRRTARDRKGRAGSGTAETRVPALDA